MISSCGVSSCRWFSRSLSALAIFGLLLTLNAAAKGEEAGRGFVPSGAVHSFPAVPGVHELVFIAQRGKSPFDRIALHRVINSKPGRHPFVMLYLPGTNMNGEIADGEQRYSMPLYLAANGVDFWALDYRTHFVPPDTPMAGLSEMQTWTNEMFEADIAAAARFVMATIGQHKVFVAGFSRGAFFACLYAAAYPDNVQGLILYDGIIGHGRSGSPPPGIYADDVSGRHLTWSKREALMRLVIENPQAPAPIPQFKTAAENLDHVVYDSAGFGGKGGLANPFGGFDNPVVLARVLVRYDRYWPNVQDFEDSFTPALAESLRHSKIPVLAFSSSNMAPNWPQTVAKTAAATGSYDVTVKNLPGWGHLDVICGNQAESEVFAPTLQWLKQRQR
jgi:pimeloyl-ACP methyl ester carboxylesterase